jgi:WD40 repeat protein
LDFSAFPLEPDGQVPVKCELDHSVTPADLPTATVRAVLTGHTDAVRAVAVAPDGSWLATSGDGDTVRVWDATDGVQRVQLSVTGGYSVYTFNRLSW